MKPILAFLYYLLVSNSSHAQDDYFRQTYVFDGLVTTDKGQELKIKMNFLVLLDSTIVGSYYYKPLNGSLKVVGQLRPDNSFTLSERDENGNITGYFSGNLATDKTNASGNWTSSSKDKLFTFKLAREVRKSYWDFIKKNRSLPEYSNLQLAIRESDKVLSIDVASQNLSELPQKLSSLKNIVSINLLGNNFKSFPAVICTLTTLEEISLSSNRLDAVTKKIGLLKNLRILILNNNQLAELPKEVGDLTNLLYLEIGYNRLKTLPEEIKYLANLQELHIERNLVSENEKVKIQRLLPNCVIHF